MTRKDYEKFAELFRVMRTRAASQALPTVVRIDDIESEFADLLQRDNPRFDRGRFMAACQPSGPTPPAALSPACCC